MQLISDEEAEDFDFSPDSGTKSLSCPVCMEKFSKVGECDMSWFMRLA